MAPLLPTVRRGRPSQRLPMLPLLGAVVGLAWLLVRSPLEAALCMYEVLASGAYIPFLRAETETDARLPPEGVQGWRACPHAQPGCPIREAPPAAARQLHSLTD